MSEESNNESGARRREVDVRDGNLDRQREIEGIQKLLGQIALAPTYSNERHALEKIVEDRMRRNLLVSLATVNPDGTISWMPDDVAKLQQQLEAQAETYRKQIDGIKGQQAEQIIALRKQIEASKKSLVDAKEKYRKATISSGKPSGEDLPANNVELDLDGKMNDHARLLQWLTDIADLLIRRKDEGKTFADLRKELTDMSSTKELSDNQKTILEQLTAKLGGDALAFDQARLDVLLGILTEHAKLPPLDVDVTTALTALSGKLEELSTEKDKLVIERFKERAVFLDRLGGTQYEQIIWDSLNNGYKFEPDLLNAHLEALGKGKIDDAKIKEASTIDPNHKDDFAVKSVELKDLGKKYTDKYTEDELKEWAHVLLAFGQSELNKRLDSKSPTPSSSERKELFYDVVSLWDTSKLVAELKKVLPENPTGISLSEYYYRVTLSPGISERTNDLLKGGKVSAAVLQKLAKELRDTSFDTDKNGQKIVFIKIAKKIVDIAKKPGGTSNVIDLSIVHSCLDFLIDDESASKQQLLESIGKDATYLQSIPGNPNDRKILDEAGFIQSLYDVDGHITVRKLELTIEEDLQKIRDVGYLDKPWDAKLKEFAKEGGRLSSEAVGLWYNWATTLPRIAYDPQIDGSLGKIIDQEDALKQARDALQDVQTNWNDQPAAFQAVIGKLKDVQAQREQGKQVLLPSSYEQRNIRSAAALGDSSLPVFTALEKMGWESVRSPEVRTAMFWVAMKRGVAMVERYFSPPESFIERYLQQYPKDKAELDAYLARNRAVEAASGVDITKTLDNDMGVRVRPDALARLAELNGPNGLPMSIDISRIGSWMTDPASAETALQAILYDSTWEGNASRLIHAFSKKQTVDYAKPDGSTGKLTHDEAKLYVRSVQIHLLDQLKQRSKSTEQIRSDGRFTDPLEVVRSAKDTLQGMLQSGDFAQQAVAVGLIVGAIAAIRYVWSAKNKEGKTQHPFLRGLLIGIPTTLGLDIVLQRMTGEGVFDRLGLHFMNHEDRTSAVEQFIRRGEQRKGFENIGNPAGYAAMQQIMNPNKPIPVADMLRWRQMHNQAYSPGGTLVGVRNGMPSGINLSAVRDKFADMQERKAPSDVQNDKAATMVLDAFESLCIDVAEANGLPEPKGDEGALYLRQMYVDFDTPNEQQFLNDFNAVARSRGGFSVFDVLIFERRTPALDDVYTHPYLVEWLAIKLHVTKEWLLDQLKQGMGWGAIKIAAAKQAVPEAIDWTKGVVIDSADTFYKWAQVAYAKGKPEVQKELLTTWNLISGTFKGAGLLLRTKGPGAVEWVFYRGVDAKNFTVAKALSLYRELHRYHVTGVILDAFETFYQNIVHSTEKEFGTKEHLEKISQFDEFYKSLALQLGHVATVPTDDQVKKWLESIAGNNIVAINKETPQKRLLYYEFLKRKIFSALIARRIEKIAQLDPEKATLKDITGNLIDTWPDDFDTSFKDNKVYQYVLSNYNSPLIFSLMGNERTFVGSMKKLVNDNTELWRSWFSNIALWTHIPQNVSYEQADDFLARQWYDYFEPLRRKAAEKLGEDSPEYERYIAYLQTVATNVVVEKSLESEKPFTDITLTDEEAGNMYHNLWQSRGTAPDIDGLLEKENPLENPLIEYFTATARPEKKNKKGELLWGENNIIRINTTPPAELETIRRNSGTLGWILEGMNPPAAGSPATSGGAKPSASPAPSATSAPAEAIRKIQDLKEKANNNPLTKDDLRELSRYLHSDQEVDVREIYDINYEKYSAAMSDFSLSNNRDMQFLQLAGMSEAKYKDVITAITTTPRYRDISNLQELTALQMKENDLSAKKRIEEARNKGIIYLLALNALNPMLTAMRQKKDLSIVKEKPTWQHDLLILYEASGQSSDPRYLDTVSLVLEVLVFDGKYNSKKDEKGDTGYALFKTFLKNEGKDIFKKELGPPPEVRGKISFNKGESLNAYSRMEGSGSVPLFSGKADRKTKDLLDEANARVAELIK